MTLVEISARCEHCADCWQWRLRNGAIAPHPQIKKPGNKVFLVRRMAYAGRFGPIQPGLRILPTCGNRMCINPEHQKAVTEREKGKIAAAQGAWSSPARAEKIARTQRLKAKLTMDQADTIRMSAEAGHVLAKRYGVNTAFVNRIKRGEAWRDFTSPWAGLMP